MNYRPIVCILSLAALGLIIDIPKTADAQPNSVTITVETDNAFYNGGSVIIFGKVSGTFTGEKYVVLQVYGPENNEYLPLPAELKENGSYVTEFTFDGEVVPPDGVYRVVAHYGTVESETSFRVDSSIIAEPGCISGCTYGLEAGGETFEIGYLSSSVKGQIENMTLNEEKKSLSVSPPTDISGIVIVLPKKLIQSSQGEVQTDFVVLVNGQKTELQEHDPEPLTRLFPSMNPDDVRVLEVRFDRGPHDMEIIGTWVAPEFGLVTPIIFALGVTGIILLGAKYRSRFP